MRGRAQRPDRVELRLPALPVRGVIDPHRHITATRDQAGDGNVLVDVFPVQARAADLDLCALLRRGVEEARKPRQRHTPRAAVRQVDPHRMLVEADLKCRNDHAMPRGDCSPDGASA